MKGTETEPLFSCIVAFCVLILIFLPRFFFAIVFSPVLIITGAILISLLRFGAIQRSKNEEEKLRKTESVAKQGKKTEEDVKIDSFDESGRWVLRNSEENSKFEMGFESSSFLDDSFVEWNVKAPLEVIYEGEETEEGSVGGGLRNPSWSFYYPESDSDSSSSEKDFPAMGNWDSPEEMGFMWDEEEDTEGLIEISLDGWKKKLKKEMEFGFEEENMIEIDLSPTKLKGVFR
ncbi:uncharacterized protein LOC131631747 [Vicia villosa]|uniref:uncharacterized protein LOC131631747 n=1 Tax=Vicia villosa TaxID=3911 RepID=UPI00273BD43C|nr:uncharacterized protein LOC131631747 [Vicia villosa]